MFQWKTSDSSHVKFLNACIMRPQNVFPLTFIIPTDYLFSRTGWSLKRHSQPLFITWVKHTINQQTTKSADWNPHKVNGKHWELSREEKKLSNDSDRCTLGGEALKNLRNDSSDVDGLDQVCSNLNVLRATPEKFGLHAYNIQFSTENEEWISICVRIITCTILLTYFLYFYVVKIYS
jgi:hypothetical protein